MRGNSGEVQLWQTVLFQAVKDALTGLGQIRPRLEWVQADRWIRGGGKDFRLVCALAGVDADLIRDAYTSGRFSLELLVMSETGNRKALAGELRAAGEYQHGSGRFGQRRAIGAGR